MELVDNYQKLKEILYKITFWLSVVAVNVVLFPAALFLVVTLLELNGFRINLEDETLLVVLVSTPFVFYLLQKSARKREHSILFIWFIMSAILFGCTSVVYTFFATDMCDGPGGLGCVLVLLVAIPLNVVALIFGIFCYRKSEKLKVRI